MTGKPGESFSHGRLRDLARRIVQCRKCPRLVKWRREAANRAPDRFEAESYWSKPVPGFGDPGADLMVLGLAPGAHGTNRTGRMFTGHRSADWLMSSMHSAGFASRPTSSHRGDGLTLNDTYLTAVVRCPPPGDQIEPPERKRCRPYLEREIEWIQPRVVLCLGRYAYNHAVRILRESGSEWVRPRPEFEHGRLLRAPGSDPDLLTSYHPSQRNMHTGTIDQSMLDNVFRRAQERLEESSGR